MRRVKSHPRSGVLVRIYNVVARWRATPDVLFFAAFLTLYVMTLCPSIYTFDSAELTAGAYSLGIVHPTGYPVYLMLAKLFSVIVPIGDIAYRVNLFSAVCAALTLVVLRRVAFMITGRSYYATLAIGMLGVSYPLWSVAVVAEVYTLHVFFLSGILWLILRWRVTGRPFYFIMLGLVTGLSFGNHMSTILVVPGVAILVWEQLKRPRNGVLPPPVWIAAGVGGIAGLRS
jgi:hypothetical protein